MMSRIVSSVAAILVLTGCSTVDPLMMERTARDEEEYTAAKPVRFNMGQRKVFVVSKVVEHQRARETNHLAFLSKAMEASTAQYFSNLGWFRTLDRQNGLAVDASKELKKAAGGEVSGVPESAEFLLLVESSVSFIAKQGWKMTSHSKKARGAQVESDFRLVDVKMKETVSGMKFRSTAECGKGDVRTAISTAADMNVRKFARLVSARYLPPGRVTETRGSGRCARISIGKNYLLNAKTDKLPATRVDFFIYDSDKNSVSAGIEKVIIAHGTVISADKSGAWVEVDADWIDKTTHLATYNVKKGHYVKISEEAVEEEVEVE